MIPDLLLEVGAGVGRMFGEVFCRLWKEGSLIQAFQGLCWIRRDSWITNRGLGGADSMVGEVLGRCRR